MAMYAELKRPTIKIFYRGIPQLSRLLREIGYGIEEEGIPFETEEFSNNESAVGLALEAASESQMEVGIGIDPESVVLQIAKLKRDEPLFKISARSTDEEVRIIGTNAGRLVKNLPLVITEGNSK
ncbi:MAG: glycerol dehydratase reactivase beta/small subunit family protein [Synergistes sp.]|nr:glycerol dehydratase reactivase beta/small subunit family protein [Synergistes sp.]